MNCANHPDRERTAFCQNCGKPLCQECTRTVGSAVFCEPCLAARLSGIGNPVGSPVPGEPVPPPPPDEPNPGLAALLGFIPGVGAMYNGQYAKGIVHLIVFAILVSLAGENGIFGLFIAGWIFYQVIEAHHTAQARRDGTPLPNPFGLNDLGERLGFGRAWPSGSSGRGYEHRYEHRYGQGYGQGAGSSPDATPPPAPNDPPPASGYRPPPPGANWGAPWDNYVPPVPPSPPFAGQAPPNFNPADFNPAPRNHFPMGAVWLILLGAIFLIGNSGIFHGFAMHLFVPLLLIGFGVWQFVHKMTETGTLADDGTPSYRFRLFHALRSAVWIILIGVLFLLDSSHILSWGRSWPLFIIVAGVMTVLQRSA
ncbi:MAG TPA: B-box zinc finger protein, partial [Edaphobacter sp.]|nr:B-box zinc finger protein [Edaphobacter sp.]